MKKLIIAALMTLLPLSAFALDSKLQTAIDAVPQINNNCSASVIYSDRNEETGKVRTVLLTAKHCIDNQANGVQNIVEFPVYQNNRVVKKDHYTAKVLGRYYKADLALLELDDTQTLFKKTIQVAEADIPLTLGDETVVVGYPFSMGINVTFGNFMSIIPVDAFAPGQEFIRATPDIGPGNSGGALLKKVGDDYQLIGVTTAVIPGWPFTGLFTGVKDINEYLKTALPEALPVDAEELEDTQTIVSPTSR
jgi:hypothetical protein